jgi:hypothetical protein
MTATIRPIRCPHGAPIITDPSYAYVAYEDGCRATSGAPVRFWCGPDEMSKPNGVSITAGEYLRDWDLAIEVNEDERRREWYAKRDEIRAAHTEALILNEGDELYDEAARENFARWSDQTETEDLYRECTVHPGYDVTWGQDPIVAREHAEFLAVREDAIRSVWGGEVYDEDAASECRGVWGQVPIVVSEYYDSTPERNLDICGWCGGLNVLDPRTAACVSCAPRAEDAGYLGEVPWSDRVGD